MASVPVLELDNRPASVRQWCSSMRAHRDVLFWLARSDFQVRYKRAVFGVLWSVVVPLLQALVLIVVFSKFSAFDTFPDYPIFVLTGIASWAYFTAYVSAGSTAIVDQAALTDKVWFPRAILPLVPGLASAVSLLVNLAVIIVLAVVIGLSQGWRLALLPFAVLLLYAFTSGLVLVLSALHVYFRDVRYLVQAALLVWFWLTPVAYPQSFLKGAAPWLALNPMTGVVNLFRVATVGTNYQWRTSVLVSVVCTVLLLVISIEVHRRHDRLFVDLL